MRKIVLLTVSLLFLAASSMSQTFVQAKTNSSLGTATTVTIAPTTGHMVVIIAYQGANNTSTLTISDNVGTAIYTQVPCGSGASNCTSPGYVSSGGDRFAMFYNCSLPSGTYSSITATWSGGLSATIPVIVQEWSGLASSGCLDPNGSIAATTTQSGSHTSFTSGSLSSNHTNDVLIFGVGAGGGINTTISPGTGFTLPSPTVGTGCTSNTRSCMTYEIVSSTQSSLTTSLSYTSTNQVMTSIFAAFSTTSSSGKPSGQFPRVY